MNKTPMNKTPLAKTPGPAHIFSVLSSKGACEGRYSLDGLDSERAEKAKRALTGSGALTSVKSSRFPSVSAFSLTIVKSTLFIIFSISLLTMTLNGCSSEKGGGKAETPLSYSLIQHGDWVEAIDCAGRSLALIPEGSAADPKLGGARTVKVPARRVVVASGHYDAGVMAALGKLSVMVAADEPADTWRMKEVREKIESGEIAFVGYWDALDIEAIRRLNPDLVLTSSPEVGQVLERYGFPTAVTYNGFDNGLENRLRLFGFLGALLGAEAAAKEAELEIRAALKSVKAGAEGLPRPKIGWGVFFNNRVYALDWDFWLAEIMAICGGDYVMSDLSSGMLELDIEEFLSRSAPAEIYFASLIHEGQIETKADYLGRHPELSRVKAFGAGGRVVSPQDLVFQDTGRLESIVKEVAAIIHPELYPDIPAYYFRDLP